jgi:DNA-binding response OmpR family regulator
MAEDACILAIDRNRRNLELLAQFLNKEGYHTVGANSLEEFDRALSGEPKIKLVLLDISGFDRHIWDYCQKLREAEIPFLVLSPRQSAAIQQESFARGARTMLVKPLVVKELLSLIRGFLGEQI